ncbi:translation initiation factor eIF3 core subunit g [Ascoidea rubescens DSM 1968]|uniref:Eukaryotic translation initiation factor 3 subunit G n=1 Tax=Ascoidea rubescens DSM 1968 TaxID=1344418 RepID=A0A1D2V997_9ASCO|nr:eIF-3 RNA-binding subunit [Ascoidea rubescens DSM 1968]ODV58023.1 eIF-3 RNA-binding subunit [Ascoidea rubescens DSM 1968]
MHKSKWADAEDELPSPEVIKNPDGTKTVISYRYNDQNKKVKITQKIKDVVIKEHVHPLVAERKKWAKYGEEKGNPVGPDIRTTQLGEPVNLILSSSWREAEKEEEKKAQENPAGKKAQRIVCRLCKGDHFTTKCPFKETMGAPESIEGNNAEPLNPQSPETSAEKTAKGGYVPPHLRKRNKDGSPATPSLGSGSRYGERDDSTTLRVSQLNEIVTDIMIKNELFANHGPLTRVTLVKNKETGKSKGLAYVAFPTVEAAQRAMEDLDGRGYHSLILHIEFSKPRK